MSNLLQVIKMQSQTMQKQAGIPVMVEFPVNPETAPFLVSSSTGLVWVEEAHPGDLVKAAPRHNVTPGGLFLEVIEAVGQRGQRDKWGNKHSFSAEGVRQAIEYVASYDLENLEILVPRVRDEENTKGSFQRPEWLTSTEMGLPVRPTSWLPDDCAIILPRERDYVGLLGRLSAKIMVVVVHNGSRSLGIARGFDE